MVKQLPIALGNGAMNPELRLKIFVQNSDRGPAKAGPERLTRGAKSFFGMPNIQSNPFL